ncbi:TrmB family transcriptional regulator [Paenibacillus sp. ACRRX]|uniref:TrmB family transcriptional regulator n=1 Tax=Paenibacillus sp. ACRRX TaxID=2918206 RepID=UPI001EF5B218|nr:TrmB family transcriptional regulator [Paenibacillus sp. ACRRX]MCG7408420.1 TrmB family transcriptional regulator [Paenibacillus sp. ACRRX]
MLQKFGFSQYESKVYEALVTHAEPMDATTIVKHSGVPKAKIYEVIAKLVEKGIVSDAVSGKKRTYAAIPMQIVIDKLTHEFERDIADLRRAGTRRTYADDQVWSLKTNSSIQAYCRQLIDQAERSIVLSMWVDEFKEFAPLLEQKEQQGVDVEVLVTGGNPGAVKLTKMNVLEPTDGHEMILEQFKLIIADGNQVLFAGMEEGNWQAMRTMAQPFVKFFTEFFHHDVALAIISRKYATELMQDAEMKALLMRLRY